MRLIIKIRQTLDESAVWMDQMGTAAILHLI